VSYFDQTWVESRYKFSILYLCFNAIFAVYFVFVMKYFFVSICILKGVKCKILLISKKLNSFTLKKQNKKYDKVNKFG